jgi:hypothetical protein
MRTLSLIGGLLVPLAACTAANAGLILIFDDGSGLSAEAEFTLLGVGDVLEVRLKNSSTSIPNGFDPSDQLLTGISWDFGHVGFNGDVMITGGTVATGSNSSSINFSVANVGPNSDVSGEYGYGNMDGTGALPNFVSGNAAQATPFGGANLDGPAIIDGPQAGLLSSLASIPLGGLGAIQDEIIATLSLSEALISESEIFGLLGEARVEFGSDAHFIQIPIPAPGSMATLCLAGVFASRRRRR